MQCLNSVCVVVLHVVTPPPLQAEIRRLREVQRVASYERKLMLLQQREISKIRRSAKYYQEKIQAYSFHHHDLQQSLSSPCLSRDESRGTEVSVFTMAGFVKNYFSLVPSSLVTFICYVTDKLWWRASLGTRLELHVVEAVTTLHFAGARGVNS